jgi:hypothetical protein
MPRKIKQILAMTGPQRYLYALADDGSVWAFNVEPMEGEKSWERVPDLPEKPEEPGELTMSKINERLNELASAMKSRLIKRSPDKGGNG